MKKLWRKLKALLWPSQSVHWTFSRKTTMPMPNSTVWVHEEHYKGETTEELDRLLR